MNHIALLRGPCHVFICWGCLSAWPGICLLGFSTSHPQPYSPQKKMIVKSTAVPSCDAAAAAAVLPPLQRQELKNSLRSFTGFVLQSGL